MAETIDIDVDGKKVAAVLGMPQGGGIHPGILVMHHQEGLSPFTRNLVDKLAGLGCVVLAVDSYHPFPPGTNMKTCREGVTDPQMMRDAAAGIAYLQSSSRVQRDNLAVIGHCMGGRTALLAAETMPVFNGVVVYYGGGVFKPVAGGSSVGDRLGELGCPVIGFWGGRDRVIPNEQVDRIEAKLAEAGVPHEFHRYPDANHAFANFTVPEDYRADADRHSWQCTVDFLRRTLKLAA
jgi:carboxymethylenebutenolidase